MPTTVATIDALKAYRNDASGIFVHKVYNLLIVNGRFADNNIGVDLDRTEGVVIRDTVVVGESASYRTLMARQTVGPICRKRKLVGVDLHTWHLFMNHGGITIQNVNLSGFHNVTCKHPSTIHMDDMVSFFLSNSVKEVSLPTLILVCFLSKMFAFVDVSQTLTT